MLAYEVQSHSPAMSQSPTLMGLSEDENVIWTEGFPNKLFEIVYCLPI